MLARSSATSLSRAALALSKSFRNGFHKQPCPRLERCGVVSLSGNHHRPAVASSARHARSTASPLVRTHSSERRKATACHWTYVRNSQPHFMVRASVSRRIEYSMFSREVIKSLSLVSCGSVAPGLNQHDAYSIIQVQLTPVPALMWMIDNQPHFAHNQP